MLLEKKWLKRPNPWWVRWLVSRVIDLSVGCGRNTLAKTRRSSFMGGMLMGLFIIKEKARLEFKCGLGRF